ncbi:penicillin-binding protein 1B [Marinobacter fonticola]|uniref:penicillin-binding protein 1B n=1 Tax=Marinobacter fonticola TaxID=2603215 RepID=UPI001D0D953E
MAKSSPKRRGSGRSKKKHGKSTAGSGFRARVWRLIWRVGLVGVVILAGWTVYLDAIVTSKFEGRRWEVPSRVYARPLELYDGAAVTTSGLSQELSLLGYAPVRSANEPGTYSRAGRRFEVHTRGFRFSDGQEPQRRLRFEIVQDRVGDFRVVSGGSTPVVRLDPVQIGGIYPAHKEDRVLIQLEDMPDYFSTALLATEDRDFFDHWGVAPLSIARAMWANIQAGRVVQGGSTLTQQLVKNLYLTREQTLVRKGNEALMALLLELHYEKSAILETYLNEVYLGQAGQRAVHGFGLASQFYFGEHFRDLDLHEVALLVAIIKGPSYYDPRRHPQRALDRRNLVLDLIAETGKVPASDIQKARQRDLDVVGKPSYTDSRYPAYLDLVRRHLAREYKDEDLQSEGLRIFTTLNPEIQRATESAVEQTLNQLEGGRTDKKLESAAVVTARDSGEVLALVGGRDPQFAGFNRAVDARRPVGSLIKPFIYLTALSQPDRYTLITPIKDQPFSLVFDDGRRWEPENYDKQSHGVVPLHQALSRSYNLATVRVGLDVGIDAVIETLQTLGVGQPIQSYPSMLLGAVNLSPVDVASLYQSLATSGFNTPLRTIREVTTSGGETLTRYGLNVDQVVDPAAVHLVQYAMQEVMQEGTGRSAYRFLSSDLGLAGKTGTTNDGRDSWFAGFSGDLVTVTWVGRDDNGPTALTGATGALPVWSNVMSQIPQYGFSPIVPAEVQYHWVNSEKQALTDESCSNARFVPFIAGSEPTDTINCSGDFTRRLRSWFEGLF